VPAKTWTYDSLAAVDRDTLEKVLLDSPPPDLEQLVGWIYCGWNHEWIASHLSGEKFKKAFWKRNGKHFGYNHLVVQDHKGHSGEWKDQLRDGGPIQLGFFRCSMTSEESSLDGEFMSYLHTAHFNYDLADLNSGVNVIFRPVRDFVVLPNPGDHSLMLCKAYFHLGPQTDVFYCYFLLGRREKITHFPSW
jgi:hypothetical protein